MASTRACLRSLAAAGYGLEEILDRCQQDAARQHPPDNCFVTLALTETRSRRQAAPLRQLRHSSGYLWTRPERSRPSDQHCPSARMPLQDFTVGPVQELPMEPAMFWSCSRTASRRPRSPDKRFFGDRRALEVVRSHLHAPAEDIVGAIHDAARAFCEAQGAQDESLRSW